MRWRRGQRARGHGRQLARRHLGLAVTAEIPGIVGPGRCPGLTLMQDSSRLQSRVLALFSFAAENHFVLPRSAIPPLLICARFSRTFPSGECRYTVTDTQRCPHVSTWLSCRQSGKHRYTTQGPVDADRAIPARAGRALPEEQWLPGRVHPERGSQARSRRTESPG